ncbi:YceD family protein [Rhodococcus sp. NPDC058505]|uniref:YceD family protein n=1 Tax=unclassified Rhodococcus (in: high G+C Gram-positive bacteria) TaxID=192944 RepID=UPI0036666BBD
MSSHRSTSPRPHDGGFVLDTRTLGRRPGSMTTLTRTVPTPIRIGLDLVAVPVGADVELDLRLESVSEGVLVTGTVRAATVGECSRCLEPFEGELNLHLTELFAYPDSVTEETTEEDEVYRIVDEMIDLEPVIVDAAGLELPLQPLCSEDCQGLCPECGIRLAIAESGHGHEILDPRWAALAGKLVDADSVEADAESSTSRVNTEAEEK